MTHRRTTEADYARRILRAQQLLQEQLSKTVDPATLASAANFSLHHFHRIFRAQTGESVMQHVRRLRLERAARLLRHTDVRLIDLAIEAGYESHEAFTRAFTAHFGVPPSLYREQPSERLSREQAENRTVPSVAVTVNTYPALRVAFIRHHGSYANIGMLWEKMFKWATTHDLIGETPVLYGVCHDDPDITEEKLLRFDACIAVSADFTTDRNIGITEIPPGTYAVGVHRGPYSHLPEAYLDVIGRWFPTSGYEPAPDPIIEHYLNDPRRYPPEELLTEVRVRIAD